MTSALSAASPELSQPLTDAEATLELGASEHPSSSPSTVSRRNQRLMERLQRHGAKIRRRMMFLTCGLVLLAVVCVTVCFRLYRLKALLSTENPHDLCDKPFAVWYAVKGVFALIEAGVTVLLLYAGSRLLANKNLEKLCQFMHHGEDSSEDLEKEIGPDAVVYCFCCGGGSCALCLAFSFDIGWYIYGIHMMITAKSRCDKEALYFWYLLASSIAWSCLAVGHRTTLTLE